jgi:hypothetical protein
MTMNYKLVVCNKREAMEKQWRTYLQCGKELVMGKGWSGNNDDVDLHNGGETSR